MILSCWSVLDDGTEPPCQWQLCWPVAQAWLLVVVAHPPGPARDRGHPTGSSWPWLPRRSPGRRPGSRCAWPTGSTATPIRATSTRWWASPCTSSSPIRPPSPCSTRPTGRAQGRSAANGERWDQSRPLGLSSAGEVFAARCLKGISPGGAQESPGAIQCRGVVRCARMAIRIIRERMAQVGNILVRSSSQKPEWQLRSCPHYGSG